VRLIAAVVDADAGRLGTVVSAGTTAIKLTVALDGLVWLHRTVTALAGTFGRRRRGFRGLAHPLILPPVGRESTVTRNKLRGYNVGSENDVMKDKKDLNPNKDISPLLNGWDYEAGSINVRKIRGVDGHPKLQMRLDLGLLQMEMTGRPDGTRPHGHESLLEYFEQQLTEHERLNGTQLGFHLTRRQCALLREEAGMYYHRYLGLFVLEDFPSVVRDTARNLRVLDLCGQYAMDEQDRLILEQYRPYITMMNTRAQASLELRDGKFDAALQTVKRGLKRIKEFFNRFGQEEVYADSHEVRALKRLGREIRKKLPDNPLKRLQLKLNRAVKNEKYEQAAVLRDQIEAIKRELSSS
jgi:hypothetical protein